ncbi:hypothetical protein HY633_04895 [Candidatus Uhrbacteria bacterium]|nr:hypothetical protein [Candidatus Uhrbacteria bacterium]
MIETLTRAQLAFVLVHIHRRTLRYYRDWAERMALELGLADKMPPKLGSTALEDAIDQMVADKTAEKLLAKADTPLPDIEEFAAMAEKACRAVLPVVIGDDPDLEKKIVATATWCAANMHNRFVPWIDAETVRREIEAVLELSTEAGLTPDRYLAKDESWDAVLRRIHDEDSFKLLALARQTATVAESVSNRSFVVQYLPGQKPSQKKVLQMVAARVEKEILAGVDEFRPFLEKEVKRLWPDKTDIQ